MSEPVYTKASVIAKEYRNAAEVPGISFDTKLRCLSLAWDYERKDPNEEIRTQ